MVNCNEDPVSDLEVEITYSFKLHGNQRSFNYSKSQKMKVNKHKYGFGHPGETTLIGLWVKFGDVEDFETTPVS